MPYHCLLLWLSHCHCFVYAIVVTTCVWFLSLTFSAVWSLLCVLFLILLCSFDTLQTWCLMKLKDRTLLGRRNVVVMHFRPIMTSYVYSFSGSCPQTVSGAREQQKNVWNESRLPAWRSVFAMKQSVAETIVFWLTWSEMKVQYCIIITVLYRAFLCQDGCHPPPHQNACEYLCMQSQNEK